MIASFRHAFAAALVIGISQAPEAIAQTPPSAIGVTSAVPWQNQTSGTPGGPRIPMANIAFPSGKSGSTSFLKVAGGNPFSPPPYNSTSIPVVIVPIAVVVGSTRFGPRERDACIANNIGALYAVDHSPIFLPVKFDGLRGVGHAAMSNGINVGPATYLDAFRRAEWWNTSGSSSYHTALPYTVTANTLVLKASEIGGGNVIAAGCEPIAVLPEAAFQNWIVNTALPATPEATPASLVVFLLKNVVTTTDSALDCKVGCTVGYHSATGATPQTFVVAEYDTTSGFWAQPGITDISILSQVMGDWIDDPLATNTAPNWGGIGQVGGCSGGFEAGMPLTGTDYPTIKMPDGVVYHPQELAYWSWFMDSPTASNNTGTGGLYSMNGTFKGPSKVCPTGGTY